MGPKTLPSVRAAKFLIVVPFHEALCGVYGVYDCTQWWDVWKGLQRLSRAIDGCWSSHSDVRGTISAPYDTPG